MIVGEETERVIRRPEGVVEVVVAVGVEGVLGVSAELRLPEDRRERREVCEQWS